MLSYIEGFRVIVIQHFCYSVDVSPIDMGRPKMSLLWIFEALRNIVWQLVNTPDTESSAVSKLSACSSYFYVNNTCLVNRNVLILRYIALFKNTCVRSHKNSWRHIGTCRYFVRWWKKFSSIFQMDFVLNRQRVKKIFIQIVFANSISWKAYD